MVSSHVLYLKDQKEIKLGLVVQTRDFPHKMLKTCLLVVLLSTVVHVLTEDEPKKVGEQYKSNVTSTDKAYSICILHFHFNNMGKAAIYKYVYIVAQANRDLFVN